MNFLNYSSWTFQTSSWTFFQTKPNQTISRVHELNSNQTISRVHELNSNQTIFVHEEMNWTEVNFFNTTSRVASFFMLEMTYYENAIRGKSH